MRSKNTKKVVYSLAGARHHACLCNRLLAERKIYLSSLNHTADGGQSCPAGQMAS